MFSANVVLGIVLLKPNKPNNKYEYVLLEHLKYNNVYKVKYKPKKVMKDPKYMLEASHIQQRVMYTAFM